ncbi:MAG: tetraacyldisaccharide 4'-kinase [Luteitalea sp.]|nr:tetraacyldisaccharide 4'-kinase [Luteitalea sp.]
MTGSFLLAPFSAVYATAARLRRRWYRLHPEAQRTLRGPVISVGNIALGGRRKTPLVAALARWLVDHGERPAILTRGYGREHPREGVVVVRDVSGVLAPLAEAGDEPFMLAQMLEGCAVLVCSDRYAAGRLAETQLGCTVHLLDDGFQHLRVARQVDLVVVHPQDVTSARVLPSGRLREPLDALDAADAAIWIESPGNEASHARQRHDTHAAQFIVRHRLGRPRPLAASPPMVPLAPPARIIAIAAIAEPQRFFDDLREAGWDVADVLTFRDHHRFCHEDLEHIGARLHQAAAVAVLTTEKDGVRLAAPKAHPTESDRMLPFPVAVVPLDVSIDPPEAFFAWLAERVESARVAITGQELVR